MLHAVAPVAIQWVTAIAQLLAAVLWPAVVLVLLLIFRKPVIEALRSARRLRVGPVEVERDRVVANTSVSVVESLVNDTSTPSGAVAARRPKLRDLYGDRVDDNPLNAILEAFVGIEQWCDAALRAHGFEPYDGVRKLGVTEMLSKMLDWGWLKADGVSAGEGLQVLRDLAMHKRQGRETQRGNGVPDPVGCAPVLARLADRAVRRDAPSRVGGAALVPYASPTIQSESRTLSASHHPGDRALRRGEVPV